LVINTPNGETEMKFDVEIDLDWIEEDSTIDETIKHQIITNIENRVVSALQAKVLESAQKKIDEQIGGLVKENVHKLVTEKVVALMALPRTETDKYGRVTRENFTIESLLIEAVEKAVMTATLDEQGRVTDGYHAKYSYFQYYATKDIPALIQKRIQSMTEELKKDIETQIKNNIKAEVADKLTSLIVENSTALSLRSGKPAA
jgi:hypothetical protein